MNAFMGWLSLGLVLGLLAYVIVRYVRSWRDLARRERGSTAPASDEDR